MALPEVKKQDKVATRKIAEGSDLSTAAPVLNKLFDTIRNSDQKENRFLTKHIDGESTEYTLIQDNNINMLNILSSQSITESLLGTMRDTVGAGTTSSATMVSSSQVLQQTRQEPRRDSNERPRERQRVVPSASVTSTGSSDNRSVPRVVSESVKKIDSYVSTQSGQTKFSELKIINEETGEALERSASLLSNINESVQRQNRLLEETIENLKRQLEETDDNLPDIDIDIDLDRRRNRGRGRGGRPGQRPSTGSRPQARGSVPRVTPPATPETPRPAATPETPRPAATPETPRPAATPETPRPAARGRGLTASRFASVGLGAVFTAIDGLQLVSELDQIEYEYSTNQIDANTYKQRYGAAFGSFFGSAAGAASLGAIGAAIGAPIAGVGALVLGIVGGVAGAFAGGEVGAWIGATIAASLMGEPMPRPPNPRNMTVQDQKNIQELLKDEEFRRSVDPKVIEILEIISDEEQIDLSSRTQARGAQNILRNLIEENKEAFSRAQQRREQTPSDTPDAALVPATPASNITPVQATPASANVTPVPATPVPATPASANVTPVPATPVSSVNKEQLYSELLQKYKIEELALVQPGSGGSAQSEAIANAEKRAQQESGYTPPRQVATPARPDTETQRRDEVVSQSISDAFERKSNKPRIDQFSPEFNKMVDEIYEKRLKEEQEALGRNLLPAEKAEIRNQATDEVLLRPTPNVTATPVTPPPATNITPIPASPPNEATPEVRQSVIDRTRATELVNRLIAVSKKVETPDPRTMTILENITRMIQEHDYDTASDAIERLEKRVSPRENATREPSARDVFRERFESPIRPTPRADAGADDKKAELEDAEPLDKDLLSPVSQSYMEEDIDTGWQEAGAEGDTGWQKAGDTPSPRPVPVRPVRARRRETNDSTDSLTITAQEVVFKSDKMEAPFLDAIKEELSDFMNTIMNISSSPVSPNLSGGGLASPVSFANISGGMTPSTPSFGSSPSGTPTPGGGAVQGVESASGDMSSTEKPGNVTVDSGVDVSKVDKDLMGRFYAAAKEYGKPVKINSGFRSDEKQAELWVRANVFKEPGIYMPANPDKPTTINYKGQTFNVPGGRAKSSHGGSSPNARALDVTRTAIEEMDRMGLLRKYGLHRPFPNDPVHVERIGGGSSAPDTSTDGAQQAATQVSASPATAVASSEGGQQAESGGETATPVASEASGGEAMASGASGTAESGASMTPSTPSSGPTVATASVENEVAKRTPMTPSAPTPEMPSSGSSSPGVGDTSYPISMGDPGNVEPPDAAQRYALLFDMAA